MSWNELVQTRPRVLDQSVQHLIDEAWYEFLEQEGEDSTDTFSLWLTKPEKWAAFCSRYEETTGQTLSAEEKQTPLLTHMLAPAIPSSFRPQVYEVSTPLSTRQEPKHATSGRSVTFDLAAEIFETEWGQWLMLGIFVILTLVDLVTNVWMLTGREQLGPAMANASVWHWIIGLVLVFSEMYVTMARALIKRTPKNRGTQVVYLWGMLVIAILAAVYDFAASAIPLYRFIASNGELFGILGGVIIGLLVAIVTTVGSSKVVEQAKVCYDLFTQKN